jgi:solute carrier family 36 (proton-coupled amino acid transporter)
MPVTFVSGGWLFSVSALILSVILTLLCIKLILEVRIKIGGTFSEIGQKTYGRCGKIMVDISLFSSQFCFCTAYIFFISSQVTSIVDAVYDITLDEKWKWVFLPICFCVIFPLVLVRKILTFAKFHVFADIMIWVTILTCIGYGIKLDVE